MVMSFGVVTSVVMGVVSVGSGVGTCPTDYEQQGNRQPTAHKASLPVFPYIHQNRNVVCISEGRYPERNPKLAGQLCRGLLRAISQPLGTVRRSSSRLSSTTGILCGRLVEAF
jgi:hypothetical protein